MMTLSNLNSDSKELRAVKGTKIQKLKKLNSNLASVTNQLIKKKILYPGMEVHTFNASTQEAKADLPL